MSGSNVPVPDSNSWDAGSGLLDDLLRQGDLAAAMSREPLHVWPMSAVERVALADGSSVVFKRAVEPFTGEPANLLHVAGHQVPVPRLLAVVTGEQVMGMLLEDLGPQSDQDAPISEGGRLAALVHSCPPRVELPVLATVDLAGLPDRCLETLDALRREGRWTGTHELTAGLDRLTRVAGWRADGCEIPPFGMCHSEFHPTSVISGSAGSRLVDWARAFTGPGLLDLASWRDTPLPLDPTAIEEIVDAYVAAGGTETARADRGGLPAAVWAGGWHRVWIIDWYLQQALTYMPDPASDPAIARTVHRHLAEALTCLAT